MRDAPAHRDWLALAAGVGYLGLAGLATLLLSPLYLALLGATRWGEVAWCLTAQGVLFSLDAVLGPMLMRDAARADGAADGVRRRYLRGFWLVGATVGAIVFAALFRAGDAAWVPVAQGATVQAMFQFANLALLGYWHGRGRQTRAYARSAAFLVAKHGLAFLLLTQWQASGVAYFAAFATVAALEFALNWRATRSDSPGDFAPAQVVMRAQPAAPAQDVTHAHAVAPAQGFAAARTSRAFVLAALAAWPIAHVDRLWLSGVLDASRFGHYFLLGTLLLSMLHLQMPILRAFLPGMVSGRAPDEALARLRRASLALLVAPALALAAGADLFLHLWLGAAHASPEAVTTLRGMMLAAALFALAAPSVARLWRDARHGAIAAISAASLALQLATLAGFAGTLGMRAGALSWIACGLVQWIGARLAARREAG